jgi:hypothetical protein
MHFFAGPPVQPLVWRVANSLTEIVSDELSNPFKPSDFANAAQTAGRSVGLDRVNAPHDR